MTFPEKVSSKLSGSYEPFRIRSREELIFALRQAAEYEMCLMNMYLSAAYSLKDDVSEGGTAEEIMLARSWANKTIGVSRDEMKHLGSVNNMLLSVGSLPHFEKPAYPSPHPFFETPHLQPQQMNALQLRRYDVLTDVLTKLDEKHGDFNELFPEETICEHDRDEYLISVELQRFSIHSLRRFIRAEATEHVSADLVREKLEEKRKNKEPRGGPLDGITATAFKYNDVGELYEIIRDGFHYLNEVLGEENLFLGPKLNQVVGGFKSPDLVPVASIEEVDRMIDVILWQGAGPPVPTPSWYVDPAKKNHHKTFETMYAEYLAALRKNPNFDPSRLVLRNPYVNTVRDRNPHWPSHQVTEPFAAGMMQLFSGCFEVTCQMLFLTFGSNHVEEKSRDVTNIWQRLIFFPWMTQIVAPLGRILPKVPSGITDEAGRMRTIGASFESSGQLSSISEEVYFPVILFRIEKFHAAALQLREMALKNDSLPSEVANDLFNLATDFNSIKNSLINSFANPTVPIPNFWGEYEGGKAPLSLSKGFLKKDGVTTAREGSRRYMNLKRHGSLYDAGSYKTLDNQKQLYPKTSLFAIQPKGEVTKENARDFLPDPRTGYLPFFPLPFRETQKVDPFDSPLSVLTCKFSGTFMFRIATDPDHSYSRKGKSGSTYTLPGEPDFVHGKDMAQVRWGRVDPAFIRELGYPIKVEITDVIHTLQQGTQKKSDRDTARELIGAELNLIDENINGEYHPPTFRGRNYVVAEVAQESIDPFVLEITKKTDKGEIRMVKHDLLDPKDRVKKTQEDVDINNKHIWFKRGPFWLANDPTLVEHSGVYDPRGFNFQKALELEKMAKETSDPVKKANYLFRADRIKTFADPVVDIKMGWNWMSHFHLSSGDPKWNTNNEYSFVSPDTEKLLGGEIIKEYDWFIRYYVGGYDSDAYTANIHGDLVIPFRKARPASRSE
uniref:Iminophenyl-pyruvate dimer synthase domain-containing protein n=1 Tax=Percolomonas cosmopolitus TaxID=63605 RepID=A0A7S1KS85_9EUKA|eukprot:CAMPEP_0117442954 /NCGR_PEP_ID=MMETSP0759-20121206/4432_1 /TAXON_ID=63605 /ORGANISM="Percolomonas cosmopolitus, Strain WS" /LENGTH=950 /DNA_ID=CAMNT_0005234887 /DNA_START=77 /DNA_END=2929 /DNA_ORIENTATION=+